MPELRVVVSARWQQPVELLLNSPQPRVPAPASDDPPACLPAFSAAAHTSPLAARPLVPPALSCPQGARH